VGWLLVLFLLFINLPRPSSLSLGPLIHKVIFTFIYFLPSFLPLSSFFRCGNLYYGWMDKWAMIRDKSSPPPPKKKKIRKEIQLTIFHQFSSNSKAIIFLVLLFLSPPSSSDQHMAGCLSYQLGMAHSDLQCQYAADTACHRSCVFHQKYKFSSL